MREDPCFNCPLPDCDEKSSQCAVRRLHRSYEQKRRTRQLDQVTPAERLAANITHDMWMTERKAEASEGGRVFRRGTKTYRAQDDAR